MSTEKNQTPEVPVAGAFYNLFAARPGSPHAGEPHSKISLRQKAEAHCREREEMSSEKLDALSPESLRTILHELRVHQIELEMQNEELRRAEAELDASRARYFDLYDLAPVGYMTVSEQGLVLEVNLTATIMLDLVRSTLVNQPFHRLVLKEDQDIYYKLRRQLVETGEPQHCELRLVKQDRQTFWACLEATSAEDAAPPSCRIVLSDITERKQVETQLLEQSSLVSEGKALLRCAIDSMEANIAVLNSDGVIIETNKAWGDYTCENNGDPRSTGGGSNYLEVCERSARTSEDARRALDGLRSVLANRATFSFDYPCDSPSEERRYRMSGFPLVGLSGGAVVVHTNITERWRAREMANRLSAIVESSEDAIIGKDLNGSITSWNRGAERIFGYTAEEMVGTTILRLIPAERQHEKEEILGKLRRGESIKPFETQRQTKDGRLLDVSLTYSPIRAADGTVVGVAKVARDVTERKRIEADLENTANRLRLATKAGGVGVWELDVVHNVLTWDDQMYHLYGIPRDPFSSAYAAWSSGLHPDDRQRGDEEIQMALRGEKEFDTEFRVLWPNGEIHDIRALALVQRNAAGEALRMIGTNWDVTDYTLTKAALSTALERAEAGSRAKSEFLGVMSHELRTPLNGVLGYTELLGATPLNEEQKSFATTITSSGEHLLAIVNDILDFASIEHGSLAIQAAPLDIAGLVGSADAAVRRTVAEKGIEFRSEVASGVPEQITGDERRIRQILINLLGNAVKFTQTGSVVLRVSTDSEGRLLEFSVEDTGIGISPENLGCLFQPFGQVDSKTNRQFGGTGLGLAISKRLAEAMGGTITFTTAPRKGSTFTFRFPLEIPPGGMAAVPSPIVLGADGASPSSSGTELTPAREGNLVLVVDDDHVCGILAGKTLKSLGYRAEFAADGAEALKAHVAKKYFAILMDMSMPVMDGLEATRKIRELEAAAGSHVPIIALTANVMPGDCERCLAAGMDDFLTKPFNRAEMAAKLTQAGRK